MSHPTGPRGRASRAVLRNVVLAATVLGAAGGAAAQESARVPEIHGFGSIVYGKTDGNAYSVGDEEGDYDHGELSTIVLAQPVDRLTIATNLSLEQSQEGFEPQVDYAFAEWAFSDRVKLRAGRVKQPFGLYTEVFDVGTVRPFTTLPQGIYGPSGFVAEGFDGLGLTGRLVTAGRWAFDYDLYGGSIAFADQGRLEEQVEDGEGERIDNVLGGRVFVETPVQGLTVGVSAYTGEDGSARHSAYGAQAEYRIGVWSVRSELARRTEDGGDAQDAFYAEAARRFGPWQAALRYDRAVASEDDDDADGPLTRHRDASIGLNYWFAPNFVLKASYHRVSGNLFTLPSEDGSLSERTDLFVVSAQFSF